MVSLRNALAAQGLDGCPKGLLGLVPFYKYSSVGRSAFGFTLLSEVIRALRWPAGFTPTGDNPSDDSQGWQNNLQGLATDGVTWFLPRREYLQIMPVGVNMQGLDDSHFSKESYDQGLGSAFNAFNYKNGSFDCCRISAPSGYQHLGALTIDNASNPPILYIPVQPRGDNPANFPGGIGPRIMAFSLEGNNLVDHLWNWKYVSGGDQAAWCAFDPVGRMLYTSLFYDAPSSGSTIDVYSIGSQASPNNGTPVPGQPLLLTWVGQIELLDKSGQPASLQRVQGGVISANRHLYLVEDSGSAGGIVGYDLVTGREMVRRTVDYKPDNGPDNKLSQELEGICIAPSGTSPGFDGQLHVILWENGWGPAGQDLWIKHYAVDNPDDVALV